MDIAEHDLDVLNNARRAGWYVGIPLYDIKRRRWTQFAYDTTASARPTGRSRELTAAGGSEDECVREMSRHLMSVTRKTS
jgi:hypothetical protein